jgi:hypothetical protein
VKKKGEITHNLMKKGARMIKMKSWIFLLVTGIFLITGCGALIVGGAVVGAGSGTFYYVNGEMKTDYYHSFDKVWAACEKTVADMRGVNVSPSKEIGSGKIFANIENEDVKFIISYKAKNVTTVAIRVGVMGNKLSSQLLHDKISEYLAK